MGYKLNRILNRENSSGRETLQKMFSILIYHSNPYETTLRFHLTSVLMYKINNTLRMWSKENMPPLLVGVQICTVSMEISIAASSKMGINILQDPAITLLVIYPKDASSYHRDACSTMLTAVLLIIKRNRKQPRCSSTEEWRKKMWYIYLMEYYSTFKNTIS